MLLVMSWSRRPLRAPSSRPTRILVLVLILLTLSSLSGSASSVASPAAPASQNSPPKLLTDPVPDPHQAGVQWFAATGHTLRGSFLDYWNKYGGLAQFGYPITEEFFEEVGSDHKQYQVQYFERNRFEHHPENAGTPYEVLLGTLGLDFHPADPQAPRMPDPALYFPQTGHNLSGPFKSYWLDHGGLFVHGYPITEEFQEKNPIDNKMYTVQYFERSRFELHPENAGSPYEVLLGLLGRQLSEKNGYPYGWYPLYGYAPDFSWFVGYYKADPKRCRDCGCSTIRYVSPDATNFSGPGAVFAYIRSPRPSQVYPLGENQDERFSPTLQPQNFLVVFGQLDDASSMRNGPTDASCFSPKFKVDNFQFNPAHEVVHLSHMK